MFYVFKVKLLRLHACMLKSNQRIPLLMEKKLNFVVFVVFDFFIEPHFLLSSLFVKNGKM